MTNPTSMTREQAWETVAGAVDDFRIYLADEAGERAETALAFLRSEMERLEGERNIARVWKRVADDAHDRIAELQSTVERLEGECKDADLAAAAEAQLADERSERAEAAEAQLAQAESLNRKHDTETTSIHADMLALAALVGVHYDGVSSPAGFLHGDIMPAVEAIRTRLAEAERWGNDTEEQRDYWIEQESHAVTAFKAQEARAERAEAALREGHRLVAAMDARMPEGAAEDEDGWITSYRIPTGPWHRLLGWAVGTQQLALEQGDKDA